MSADFIVDSFANENLSYAHLFELLGHKTVKYFPICHQKSLVQNVLNIIKALVSDGPITLLDPAYSFAEINKLGISQLDILRLGEIGLVHRQFINDHNLHQLLEGSKAHIVLYTSGSTGLPKAVSHTVKNLCRALKTGERHQNDVWGFAFNPTHIAGVQVFLQAFMNRNKMVNLFQLTRSQILDEIKTHRITHISATPTFYRLLQPVENKFDDVQSIAIGGEPVDNSLIKRIKQMFPNARVKNLYALTEAGTLLDSDGDLFHIPTQFQHLLRIVHNQLEVHCSLLGEFIKQRLVGEWYQTGDVVEIVCQDPMRLKFVGRDRDWINIGGNKVNPVEVEEAILEHPSIIEVHVFGRKNSVLGNILCAEIVAQNQMVTESGVRQFLNLKLQAHKIPRLMLFVENIQKTRTGKLQRNA